MPILEGFDDDELHPSVIEALKRLAVAKETYALAVANVDNQYLVPLTLTEAAEQATAVRAQF